jgi:hypothetical protein
VKYIFWCCSVEESVYVFMMEEAQERVRRGKKEGQGGHEKGAGKCPSGRSQSVRGGGTVLGVSGMY